MNSRGWSGVWLGLIMAACGGDDAPAGVDAGDDPPIDAPVALRTIQGVRNLEFVTPTGATVVPLDLTGATVSVVFPPTETSLVGSTNNDGTFMITRVPEGEYDLKLGHRYLVRSDNAVDISSTILGRVSTNFADTPTHLVFDLTNLEAWQSNDAITMFSAQTGTVVYDAQDAATNAPIVGATSLAQFDYDLSTADYPALIDTTVGDQLYITQLGTTTLGPRTYHPVVRSYAQATIDIANGGTVASTGAFLTVDQTKTLDLTWDRPAFDAELTARSPRAGTMNHSSLTIAALPEAATRGMFHDAPGLVTYRPGYQTDKTAVIAAAWPYGDPYPAAWTRTASVGFYTYRFIHVGTAKDTAIFASITVDRELASVTAEAPIVPIIGAVVEPKINGVDAFSASLTGIGLTPTLSWTAPAIGVANRYYVYVTEVFDDNGTTNFKDAASIETSGTQVVIPAGVLVSGKSYIFHFTAHSSPVDLDAKPNLHALPEGYSNVISEIAKP